MISTLLLACLLHAAPAMDKLKTAPGWKVSLYAEVPNARSLALGPDGIVFVGNRSGDKVFAVLPGPKREVVTVARGLNMPNGVAYRDGDLYVGTLDQVYRYRDIRKHLRNAKAEKFGPSFPARTHHGWKFIAFGPDGWLYVPVGAPCNVCAEDPDLFATIHRISPDGRKREVVARGVRNTVGFDWHPQTKALWFTDNGRDLWGDDRPPEELNVVSKAGEHFGFPHCHGDGLTDPEFGKPCGAFTSPRFGFDAHSAALGLRFLRQRPGTVVVAQHGSWNRTTPIGYQVLTLSESEGRVRDPRPLLTGFLQDGRAWGRPVDVLELADGGVLVSDDTADAIYRLER